MPEIKAKKAGYQSQLLTTQTKDLLTRGAKKGLVKAALAVVRVGPI